ncbi:MAG: hypothetical protein CME70_17170 [Halobacteriovorax sp.]|nr:hypothetical protein [Halobacteriovorax sp.]|tara:strand:- start:101836 stop:102606 length:771 start_codon:yes stop_codon:yes gene_type:complete
MNEGIIRTVIFALTLFCFGFLEASFAYRKRVMSRKDRWPSNIGIVFIDTFLVRLVYPMGAVGIAYYCEANNYGIFNWINLSYWPSIILTIIFMDLIIYGQHVLTHKINFLWKLHQVHHSDRDLDFTSALRFHPIEIIFSMMVKTMAISIIGASPKGILVFEIILSSMAIFNHSNLYLPAPLEKIIRYVFVTPQMHIIHHSEEQFESDTNFGFNLSIWDRLFGTYTDKWKSSKVIGQRAFQREADQKLLHLLKQPFL